MTLPSDPAEALKWAFNHSGDAWWVFGLIAGGIAWTSKRMRDWNRRNAIPIGRTQLNSTPWSAAALPAQAAPAAAPAQTASSAAPGSSYSAAAAYAAAAYAAQPAYAAPAAAPSPSAPARKLHREMPAQRAGAPAQRAVTPVGRSVDVPAGTTTGAWTLTGAFADPAHARTAIVIAEVLGPPVGLR
ncbi:MAG TPA: hypothetical protein VIW69_00675 [Candidatus Elarobacter sp.]